MDNESLFDNNQFMVSYELLLLLQWLVDNDPESLNDLVQNALDNGLHEEIIHVHDSERDTGPNAIELQQSIVDFFSLLETCLQEPPSSDEKDLRSIEKIIIPSLEQIDSKQCGEDIVARSAAQVTTSMQKNMQINAKEAFCKQLLKNWNPQKTKQILN